MSLWFNREEQDKILLKYLPTGKVYKQAHLEGTNFNKLIKWIASGFTWLVDRYNETFRGLYVCESGYLIDNFKKDYNIPNEIFYNTDDFEHRKDIYILKYLMQGNTAWHFKAIANMYGYDVKVISGVEYLRGKRFVYKFPVKIGLGITDPNNILVVFFKQKEVSGFAYKFPLGFRGNKNIIKIKKIYDIIKQSQTRILYIVDETLNEERIELCLK